MMLQLYFYREPFLENIHKDILQSHKEEGDKAIRKFITSITKGDNFNEIRKSILNYFNSSLVISIPLDYIVDESLKKFIINQYHSRIELVRSISTTMFYNLELEIKHVGKRIEKIDDLFTNKTPNNSKIVTLQIENKVRHGYLKKIINYIESLDSMILKREFEIIDKGGDYYFERELEKEEKGLLEAVNKQDSFTLLTKQKILILEYLGCINFLRQKDILAKDIGFILAHLFDIPSSELYITKELSKNIETRKNRTSLNELKAVFSKISILISKIEKDQIRLDKK